MLSILKVRRLLTPVWSMVLRLLRPLSLSSSPLPPNRLTRRTLLALIAQFTINVEVTNASRLAATKTAGFDVSAPSEVVYNLAALGGVAGNVAATNAALASFHSQAKALNPDTRIVLVVPAGTWLYRGHLDADGMVWLDSVRRDSVLFGVRRSLFLQELMSLPIVLSSSIDRFPWY